MPRDARRGGESLHWNPVHLVREIPGNQGRFRAAIVFGPVEQICVTGEQLDRALQGRFLAGFLIGVWIGFDAYTKLPLLGCYLDHLVRPEPSRGVQDSRRVTEVERAGYALLGHGAHAFNGCGFGMRKQGTSSDHWIDAFYGWLETQGLTRPAGPPAR